MECSEKPVYEYKKDREAEKALRELKIKPPREDIRKKILSNWDQAAKPIDGMGRFEALTAQIGAIRGTEQIDIGKKAVLILCADNGIVEEGVSQSGPEVTEAVVRQMAVKQSSVGRMAACIGAETIPVDIGMRCEEKIPGVLDRKIRRGTRNFHHEPALTRTETVRAVWTGIRLAEECGKAGFQILAAGEMGIGNTTTSAAVAAALLGKSAPEMAGRGAGLDDARLQRKICLIEEALERYGLRTDASSGGFDDALKALSAVGGLDLAGLAGVYIGGALYGLPVVLDGVISMTAALAAERIAPGTAAYLLPSHMSREPAAAELSRALGLFPVICADMALGEGTGAVMLLALLDMALRVYQDRVTFLDMRIPQYERFTKR
ncbi:MAG TPA: nicotinate-nucleotide--dimethylbenzimidazole phosphoribosyltransferase [Candidatus Eisenbergiella intestinipullorum]|nr:nicotinate-nucleotide--dimethylbenzimidazole phosphoribosyltransferase [Candidatus Eisenbergiella intestinipullorum]